MSESTYVLDRAEGSKCPKCQETVLLLYPRPIKQFSRWMEQPLFHICPRCLTVAEVGVGPVPSDVPIIPHFPNEAEPGNAVTSLVLTTEQGVDLIFKLDPPVQQSRVMVAIGRLLGSLGAEMDFDFRLQGEEGKRG